MHIDRRDGDQVWIQTQRDAAVSQADKPANAVVSVFHGPAAAGADDRLVFQRASDLLALKRRVMTRCPPGLQREYGAECWVSGVPFIYDLQCSEGVFGPSVFEVLSADGGHFR